MSNPAQLCSPLLAKERTRILLGSYRQDETADAEVYVASVATVLAHYPAEVVERVTDPFHGIQSRLKWLPNIAEVREACDEVMRPYREQLARQIEADRTRQLIAGPIAIDAGGAGSCRRIVVRHHPAGARRESRRRSAGRQRRRSGARTPPGRSADRRFTLSDEARRKFNLAQGTEPPVASTEGT